MKNVGGALAGIWTRYRSQTILSDVLRATAAYTTPTLMPSFINVTGLYYQGYLFGLGAVVTRGIF